jgi:Spy/CpxP family protein refolding chaperone
MLAAIAVAMTTTAATASAQRGIGGRGGMQGPGMAMGRRTPGGPGALGAMMQRQIFRGVTLTQAQQAQLQKLRDASRTQMQALMKSAQADRQALRAARENGDTVALKAARQKLEGWRNRTIALRGEMQRNVRGVLTPDQQKTFDANRARLEHRATRAMRMMRQERMWGRRQAMMRAMAPNRMRFMRGRGFGPRARFQRGGGFGPGGGFHRGGGPGFQRGGRFAPGRAGPPNRGTAPDSTQSVVPPIGG